MVVEQQIKKVVTRASIIEFRSDGIVCVSFKPDVEIIVEDIDDIRTTIEDAGRTKDLLLLFSLANYNHTDKKVKEYGSQHGVSVKYGKAVAYVTNSLAQKILINFYIKHFKHKATNKLFTSEADAIKWLKTFR